MKLINEVRCLVSLLKEMALLTSALASQGSYTDEERESYREIIFSNTIQSMHVIIDAMDMMNIPFSNSSNSEAGELVKTLPSQIEGDILDPQITDAIQSLWRDDGVRVAFERSREYQLNDSAQ